MIYACHPIDSFVGSVGAKIASGVTDVASNLIGWIVYIICFIFVTIFGIFITILTYFIGVILQLNTQVINSLAVQSGFTITLAIANMGFVLGIIVIAIMTILRSQTYGMKQLLWKFIAAAILVNFSLVIGGVIINFANLFTSYFMAALPGGGGGAGAYFGFANALSGAFVNYNSSITSTSTIAGGGLNGTASQFGSGLASIITPIFEVGFTLIMLAIVVITLGTFLFMLLVRYIELSILLILMPFVWLFWVFPKLSHLWDKWWNEFLRWTFFAPIVMFFLYLAIATASAMAGANHSGSVQSPGAGLAALGYTSPLDSGSLALFNSLSSIFGSFVDTITGQALQVLVVVGLAVGGMVAADKLSIMGAGAAMNSMKGESGVGKWMKNRGRGGVLAGWRNKGKIGAGIKNAVKNPKQALSGVGGFKGAAGSTWSAVKGAPGWLASRAGANIKSAVHPYLTNREEVDDAAKIVPKGKDEREAFIASNVSTAKLMAAISAMQKDNQLDEETMKRMTVGSKKQSLEEWRSDNRGAVQDYEWQKERGALNTSMGSDDAIHDAVKALANGLPNAMQDLDSAIKKFADRLETKDMFAMGRGGSLANGSVQTKKLLNYFADHAPQLASPALSGMKGDAQKTYGKDYLSVLAQKKVAAGAGTDEYKRLEKLETSFGKAVDRLTGSLAPTPGGGGGGPTPSPAPNP
jgi:hypothetical protein